MYHNNKVLYLDAEKGVDEDYYSISKYQLSNVYMTKSFRGSSTDLQMYSAHMEEEGLIQ